MRCKAASFLSLSIVLVLLISATTATATTTTTETLLNQTTGKTSKTMIMKPPLRQTVQCACGKVKLAINSESTLRMVCYCKDCRGYYNTLNHMAAEHNHKPAARLDNWGGVDMTQLYPNEIKVLQGQDQLQTCKIRKESPVHLVYAKCCHTPMFRLGSMSALLNTHLIDEENKADVRFRVVGRDATPGEDSTLKKPHMSWSIPFTFPFVMMGRINKDKLKPLPVETEEATVLDNFKQG